jgi:hypothetical protein
MPARGCLRRQKALPPCVPSQASVAKHSIRATVARSAGVRLDARPQAFGRMAKIRSGLDDGKYTASALLQENTMTAFDADRHSYQIDTSGDAFARHIRGGAKTP